MPCEPVGWLYAKRLGDGDVVGVLQSGANVTDFIEFVERFGGRVELPAGSIEAATLPKPAGAGASFA
ncbi:hypothetical protein RA280_43725 [Cupriavidus sp. CV2]|uniref:hypothetical protein n=1 Tax=Cupriavidus ulmosensis TaxID=3065913 RepID=UPI00296AA519|nr:hypothetical protein [Cupriavidus sp. CV2]MDW3688519.1 hypothetical protein [Cupriavidus sp. CV2]